MQQSLADLFTGHGHQAKTRAGVAVADRVPGFFMFGKQRDIEYRLDDGRQPPERQGSCQQVGEAEGDRHMRHNLATCFDGGNQGNSFLSWLILDLDSNDSHLQKKVKYSKRINRKFLLNNLSA